ncbi:ABC transporter substrate-binding protein [Kribbella sp. CA-253562]|uniref:ABC transporter substrate-binding protein n=1 Tax=Kribbella sp. CA-253562 TaxID=3239942 RepID=UPI003D8C2794
MKNPKDAVERTVSRRSFLSSAALASLSVAASGTLLSACGGGNSGGPAGGGGNGKATGAVTWASWVATPGEVGLLKKFSADYQEKTDVKTTYQTVTGDYLAKMLTQLQGGKAPDAFYADPSWLNKFVDTKQVVDLEPFLNSPDAPVKFTDFFPGLVAWAKGADGKGVYGLPVDCNPSVFWFNKKLLTAAGVTQDPATAFEAGAWNLDAVTDLLSKVKASGKRGMVFEASWGQLFSWVTSMGGTAFDDAGKAVFDTDPKAQRAIEWLFDQMRAGTIVYGGSLPKGQGVDALFYGGQLATVPGYGRWLLPNLKKLGGSVEYDIAPYPSEDGKTVMPVAVFTAAMAVNAKASNKEAAEAFAGYFVSPDGVRARLAGGGNAVPVLSGLEEIVTENNDPPHGKWFLEIAKNGYALPNVMARNAKKNTDFPLVMDTLLKSKAESPKSFSTKLANLLNG